jgi:hypothetical protein
MYVVVGDRHLGNAAVAQVAFERTIGNRVVRLLRREQQLKQQDADDGGRRIPEWRDRRTVGGSALGHQARVSSGGSVLHRRSRLLEARETVEVVSPDEPVALLIPAIGFGQAPPAIRQGV